MSDEKRGELADLDFGRPWYHGTPLILQSIRAGSTVTQDRELARVFSHKPSLVSLDTNDAGERRIKHSGGEAGFLYRIAEDVSEPDIYPHPITSLEPGEEWLTTRELGLELIGPTQLLPEELLTPEEIATLQALLNTSEGPQPRT